MKIRRFLLLFFSGPSTFGRFFIGLHTKITGAAVKFFADYYQPMTDGTDGQLLTPVIMESGDFIITDDPILEPLWTNPNGGVFVSTSLLDTTLPGPVDVEGTEHTINSGKSWKWEDEFQSKFVNLVIEKFFAIQNFTDLVLSFYFVANHDGDAFNEHDICIINGSGAGGTEFVVAQVTGAAGALKMNIHTFAGIDGVDIPIVIGKRYWITLVWNGTTGLAALGVRDPLNNFNHITLSPSVSTIVATRQTATFSWGRTDGHGDESSNTTFSAVAQIMLGLNTIVPIIPIPEEVPVNLIDDESNILVDDEGNILKGTS